LAERKGFELSILLRTTGEQPGNKPFSFLKSSEFWGMVWTVVDGRCGKSCGKKSGLHRSKQGVLFLRYAEQPPSGNREGLSITFSHG
jgi:hypothetical protein